MILPLGFPVFDHPRSRIPVGDRNRTVCMSSELISILAKNEFYFDPREFLKMQLFSIVLTRMYRSFLYITCLYKNIIISNIKDFSYNTKH